MPDLLRTGMRLQALPMIFAKTLARGFRSSLKLIVQPIEKHDVVGGKGHDTISRGEVLLVVAP